MSLTRKLTLSPSVVICYTVLMTVAFFMTIALGIWMNDCVENLNYSLAAKLKLAHLVSGSIFILLAIFHIGYNLGFIKYVINVENTTWRQNASQKVIPLFLLVFLSVVVSAVLILCGVRGAIPFHCGVALLFAVLGVFHLTLNISSRKD